MAGIGFRLEKILKGESSLDIVKAHFHSVLIVAGPWIFSVISIFCLFYFRPSIIDMNELIYFRVSITYAFAFSLIVSGFFYLSLSRYLSDKLYLGQKEDLLPAFNSAFISQTFFQIVVGLIFYFCSEGNSIILLLTIGIYLAISTIWLLLILLTALRDYHTITITYLLGILLTIGSSLIFGSLYDLKGYFLGFLLGYLFIIVGLLVRVLIEFPTEVFLDKDFFSFLWKNKTLAFIGILYNLAIWIDKIVFWFSPGSEYIQGVFHTVAEYEIGSFIAYLTIIPSLSLFLIRIETGFYTAYRNYYTFILSKGSYKEILLSKEKMKLNMKNSVILLIVNQGVIALIVVTLSPKIVALLGLPGLVAPILRVCTLGAFLHSLILVGIIFILYFDLKLEAFLVSIVYCLTNGILTFISIKMGVIFWGYGYFVSSLITLLLVFLLFDHCLKRLEYLTFAKQPLVSSD